MTDHLNPAPEEEVAGEDGLSHDGDPEVEVIEEGDIGVQPPLAPAHSEPEDELPASLLRLSGGTAVRAPEFAEAASPFPSLLTPLPSCTPDDATVQPGAAGGSHSFEKLGFSVDVFLACGEP